MSSQEILLKVENQAAGLSGFIRFHGVTFGFLGAGDDPLSRKLVLDYEQGFHYAEEDQWGKAQEVKYRGHQPKLFLEEAPKYYPKMGYIVDIEGV